MATFVPKQAAVEGWQFKPDADVADMPAWLQEMISRGDAWFTDNGKRMSLSVRSGQFIAEPGDWFVHDALKGTVEVVSAAAFSVKYQPGP